MHPILFHIFGRPIYSYGVMAALGFLSAILTWQWLGRHENRPPGFAADLGFWLMTSGIIGARAAYVIANWPYYS
ncbi:MAG: prolipoprotein diacylglyceryl transferase family protein, partial [Kiritimatiellia bacterium]